MAGTSGPMEGDSNIPRSSVPGPEEAHGFRAQHGRPACLQPTIAGLLPCSLSAGSSPQDPAVDSIVREAMAERGIPGVAVSVAGGHEVVFSRHYGTASLERSVS